MKNAFSIIASFIALSIIGGAFIPLLSVQLKPDRALPSLNISYSWYNASARMIEQEVSGKLEGLFSAMKDIRNITSESYQGYGNISLEFKKDVDMDAARFEVATIIRLAQPDLPEQLSYPSISTSNNSDRTPPLLSYRLNGNATPNYIQSIANKYFVSKLSVIKGIKKIEIYGAMPNEWEITYKVNIIKSLGITPDEIVGAINNYLGEQIVGSANLTAKNDSEIIQLILKNTDSKNLNWKSIPVKKIDGRIVLLGELAIAKYKEKLPQAYYRINGLNSINIVIYPERNTNAIQLATEVKRQMLRLEKNLPPGFSASKVYDSSEDLKKELEMIGLRAIFSLIVLLLFVLIMSSQFKYLALILISLISNLLIACVLYILLDIEIHLYSLAGITISFGIIIDNSIIMIHHYVGKANRKVFISILAASLTTIGSLVIVFFLKEEQRINLIDFAWVIIINLTVSLFIALFFIPALMQKIKIKSSKKNGVCLFSKFKQWMLNFYGRSIIFNKKIKWLYFVIILLVFGLPLHFLPEKIEKEGFYANLYNKSFGSDWYQKDAKQLTEKWLGGTFRLFSEFVYEQAFYGDPQRTSLYIRGNMPEGCTIYQMNEVMNKMENYLSLFNEVEMYQTEIRSYKDAQIIISFKPEFENGAFPYYLKGLLTSKAISLGGLDWSIYGVGKGFNNALYTGLKNSYITLKGYNYDQLYSYAELLSKKLKENPRIDEISIESRYSWFSEAMNEFNLNFRFEKLGLYAQEPVELYNFVNNHLFQNKVANIYSNNELVDVVLKSDQSSEFDLWNLNNAPFESKENATKLSVLAGISKEKTGNSILKENQQYQLVVAYDFIGTQLLMEKVMKKHTEEMNQLLPLGYKCSIDNYGLWNKNDKTQYFLIFIVVLIIYFICSILLESLSQPLAIITMIPISFIGVFLTFYLFDFNFDQGGFASFVLLAGITVNSGIYLINEFNQLKPDMPDATNFEIYLHAFKNKIIPIFLTIISTILGLIPFIYSGQHEVFWFAFAVGSIGGLIFSFVAIIIYLPLFIRTGKYKTHDDLSKKPEI